MFKKFRMALSLLLVFVMCAGLMPIQSAFAEDEAAAAASEAELRAMEVLRLLNIVPDDYYDYNVSLDVGVTRADFASAAAKLINMGNENNGAVYYYDVPVSHWAHDAISTLTDMGVLNGQEDNLFRPDTLIEKNEAYKMLITILGYHEMAEYSGGYPIGYLDIARKLKLTQGVSDSTVVTRGDMFMLLYNALTAEMSEAVLYSGNQKTYRTSEDRTLLSVYWDIYKDRGIVNGLNCVTLDGGVLKPGEVKIDDNVYASDVSMTEFLGHEVEFFYQQSGTNTKKLMWASDTSRNLVLDINVNYDASFDRTSYALSYYADGGSKQRTVTLNRGITVVYNGAVASTDISEIFSLPKYTAQLISIGGSYKTAIVWAYDNLVIDSIDSTSKTVYDKNESTRKMSLDENNYEYMALYMSGGNQVSFNSLQPGYVLSSYLSQDGKYLTVRVTSEKISGIVDSIIDDDNGYFLIVNAVSYFMPKNVYENPKAGDSVTLYLDTAGDVAAYERESGNASYAPAFLTKGVIIRTLFDRGLQFNVLKSDGTVGVMRAADKLTVDGVSYSGSKTADAYSVFLSDGQFQPQLVMLKTNANGEIIMIDTVKLGEGEDLNNTLSVSVPFQENARYKSNGALGMKSVLDNNTIIFMVPSREQIADANDTSFYVVNRSTLTNNDLVNVETYKITDRIGYEQFAVMWGYEMGYTSALPVLVRAITTVLDENNCPIHALDGYQGANEVSIPASSEVSFDGIEPGMVVRANVNPNTSLLEGYEILFDYKNMEAYPPLANADAPYRTAGGYVNDLVDTVIRIGYTDPAVMDQVMYTANIPVLVYDTAAKSNNITVSSINETRTYRNAGSDCSKVLMASRNGTPVLYILYN